jgi:tetratricopeptide (TPR) repeat protein
MEYQEYVRSAERASQLVERGEYEGAIEILRQLVSSDISRIDKAMMCLNLAIVYDKMGRWEEALFWYDEGADHERVHDRYYVTERRAAYLAEKGRYRESLDAYEDLLRRAGLTEGDQERIGRQIETLRRRVEA